MATTFRFDEVRGPQFDAETYIQTYFRPMRISQERKEEREEAAKDFRDVLLFLFALLSAYQNYAPIDWNAAEKEFRAEYEAAALKYARDTSILQSYIDEKVSDFTRITQDHDLSDPYWTSDERATMEAVNDANDVVGYGELQKAIDAGYRYKTWKTERDSKVRKSHAKMEGKTIRITEYFDLDKGSMLYPHDYFNCPEECPNCRCAAIYSKDGKVTKTDGKVQFTNAPDDAILNYRKDVRNEDRAETFITYNNGVEETISAKPIVNSKNNIYVSDKVGTIKPRKLSDIESWITQSKRIVAEKGAEQPKFVIVSDTELLNTTGGRYNADKNIVYFKIMDKDADTKHSILHELFHWKDAQEYIKQGNSINAGEGFIAIIRKRSKRILDKLGINEKRAFGISTYAKSTYKKGYYEEVYTEYRTVLREGEIK